MFPLFKSYLKLSIRHSWKNKWSVLVNTVGLGIALSMCVFVYTLYAYNMEFDSFYKKTDKVYRIHGITFENGQERRNEITPTALDDKLRNEISGISSVSSFIARTMTVKKEDDFFSERVSVVSSDFFEMFEIPLWYGSYEGFGNQPIVYLHKPMAAKYFGNDVAVGEKLSIYVTTKKKIEVIVGGVFEKVPLNTSFACDFVISENDYFRTLEVDKNDWTTGRYMSHYLEIDPAQVETITANLNRYISDQNMGHKEMKMDRFELVPFISPLIQDGGLLRKNANARLRTSIYIIFTSLILMVFLIACFNLANTSIAMISKRLKEIGIRKTLGSESKQILFQFLFEMGIISALAFIIALSLANLISNAVLGLFGVSFLVTDTDLTGVLLFIVGFLVFTTLVAGLLPAIYAWRFQPIAIMRKSVKLKGVSWLNKTLTVAQYVFSIAVLSAGITFSQNSDFLKELDLGYQNEGIIDLDLRNTGYYGPIKQQVDQLAGVVTAGTKNHFANNRRFSQTTTLEMDTSTFEVSLYEVGPQYLALIGVTISAGRGFIEGSEMDEKQSILVSREFAKRYFDGNDPINEVVKIGGKRKTIVGVIANIIDDVYEDAEVVPAVIQLEDNEELRHLVVKVSNRDLDEVQEELKAIWSNLIDQPYNGRLQKDLALGQAGRDTENLQKIFVSMAVLGAFLSIVGIFSLAKLNVTKRMKEISIRKVLGSTIRELLLTINRSFVIVLLIAMTIGSVFGYFISDAVLSMIYLQYVDVSVFTSILSGVFIVLFSIVMITVAVMSSANSNPIAGLREE